MNTFETIVRFCVISAAVLAVGSCSVRQNVNGSSIDKQRSISERLSELPTVTAPLNVAVYEFPDLTGANRANDNYADYSRAVTQGASAIVVDVLQDVGKGRWFRVVERGNLNNLVKERELIQTTKKFLPSVKADIQPLIFADYIIAGAIVGYDQAIMRGGSAASSFGIGTGIDYRRDLITVNLRLVRVSDGQVIESVTASRAVYSIEGSGSLTRVLNGDQLLVIRTGVASAEPTQVAVRQSIEAALYEMITKSAKKGLWSAGG